MILSKRNFIMSHLFSYWTFHKSITRLCWTTSTSSLLHCVCKGALWNPCNSRRRNQNLFPPQYSRMFSFLDIHQNLRSWHRIFDLDVEFLTPWDLIQWMLNCLEWLDVRIGALKPKDFLTWHPSTVYVFEELWYLTSSILRSFILPSEQLKDMFESF